MLVYDGILAEKVLERCVAIANEGFRYAIETRTPPPEGWDRNLTERTWTEYDGYYPDENPEIQCVERVERISRCVHLSVGKHFPKDSRGMYNGGTLVFLLNYQDYIAALLALRETVVSESPFKTILGSRL